MSEGMNQDRTFEVLTAEPVRKRRKPRPWSDADKAPILEQALAPGTNISAIAR
jgi:transposase